MSAEPLSPVASPRARRVERLRDLWPDVRAMVVSRKRVLALGMVLVAASRAASLVVPAATKVLVDEVIGKRRLSVLPAVVACVALAALAQAAAGYALSVTFTRSTARFVTELRCKLHAHVLALPLRYHDVHKSGELASRVLHDVAGVQSLVGTALLGFLGSVVTAAAAFVMMVRWSPLLADASIGCAAAAGAIAALEARRAKAIAMERTDLLAEIQGRLTEAIAGVRVLKAYRAEAREGAIFLAGLDRLVANTMRGVTLSSRMGLGSAVLWGLVNAGMMYAGARLIVAGRLTLGEAITISVLLNYLVAPFRQSMGLGQMLVAALAGLERMRLILGEPREDRDARRTASIGPIRGEVRFEDVGFAYVEGRPVLHGVSFRAGPGTVTALVGPSGAGKSTITGLVSSFYVPTGGVVRVDGVDLGTVRLDGYRSQLGVVLQETFLFAGSILDNIAFARPGATRDEILAAARSARVDEFADALDEGYDALVGERGVRLSGGQRQRIAIARALLADPRILILDEATSSLDSTSEALIQEALARLFVGRTTFVIAHRHSTVRRAAQILVVEGGRIVERGTHADLAAAGGLYAGMYRRQHDLDDDLLLAPGEGTPPPDPVPAPPERRRRGRPGGPLPALPAPAPVRPPRCPARPARSRSPSRRPSRRR